MKEDFLHYLWASGKIPAGAMVTTAGEPVMLRDRGIHNSNAGPDFLHAILYIGDTLWSGHVEMHLNSSSWYEHQHHLDPAYRNTILHVVWHHDREVYLQDGSLLPVLALQGEIPRYILNNYRSLCEVDSRFLNCSGQFHDFSSEQWGEWLSRLFTLRMDRRRGLMLNLDLRLRHHWEELLFRAVFRYMGARVNGDAFCSLAEAVGIDRVRKMAAAGEQLEIVFHGMAGLLDVPGGEREVEDRKREYQFLCKKYRLIPERVIRPVFFRLRPSGFPTIRLSQLAGIYGKKQGVFAALLGCSGPQEMRAVFAVEADAYWDTRYSYTAPVHPKNPKRLSRERIDLLLLNAVFPILYGYFRARGSERKAEIAGWAKAMRPEHNKTLDRLRQEGFPVNNAFETQAVLELYTNYCAKNRCLQCDVGQFIIGG